MAVRINPELVRREIARLTDRATACEAAAAKARGAAAQLEQYLDLEREQA